jgi:hypothetical protein
MHSALAHNSEIVAPRGRARNFGCAVPYLIQQVAAQRTSTHTMEKCIHCRLHCERAACGWIFVRGEAPAAIRAARKQPSKCISRTGRIRFMDLESTPLTQHHNTRLMNKPPGQITQTGRVGGISGRKHHCDLS